jgi:lipopolysaccharide export system ATP-binding protein
MIKQSDSQGRLQASLLQKTYKGRTVVDKVSFDVNAGEIVGLLGPNGAGKTTSFYMIVGLIFPDVGKIFFNGEDISNLPMHLRAKKGISYLPQNASIFRRMTVEDNLLSIMEFAGIEYREREPYLMELLRKFGIETIRYSMGAALSGGERRRVEIARSLINKPKFLLLDEPFAGVDPVTVQEIQGVIKEICDDGIGVLITDHNVRETLGVCKRAYILSKGKIIAEGSPEIVSQNSLVREVYLGDRFSL